MNASSSVGVCKKVKWRVRNRVRPVVGSAVVDLLFGFCGAALWFVSAAARRWGFGCFARVVFDTPGFCVSWSVFPGSVRVLVVGFSWFRSCFVPVSFCLRHAGGCECSVGFSGRVRVVDLRGWAGACRLFPCCRSASGPEDTGCARWVSGGGLRTQERICTTSL